MIHLSHELTVLSKAVAFRNLSGASSHVGLSQPQLSRIVKKLEDELSVVLLDRAAKRNASWTPLALRIAEFYLKKTRVFESDLMTLVGGAQSHQIVMGTLEGLAPIAIPFAHSLFEVCDFKLIEIDVFDIDKLEEMFSRGDLDLIFTSHEPGKRKFKNCRELGFQSLEMIQLNPKFEVMSTFEYGAKKDKGKGTEKTLISNSLLLRRMWFDKFGGKGTLPSTLKKTKMSKLDTERIVLLGTDTLSPKTWEKIEKIEIRY